MDFLRFLTTILNQQNLQRSRIKAGRELIDYRINLYRALAGGWELAPPMTSAQDAGFKQDNDNVVCTCFQLSTANSLV
jgi:hypothetical protein